MQRILVGLDQSPEARVVLDAARTLAGKLGAKLVLFHAVDVPTEVPAQAYAMQGTTVDELKSGDPQRALDALAAELPPELAGGTRVGVGAAWRAICDAAREENADLIVIGSCASTALDRLLGTTASRVVNHADRSVLVVRVPPA